MFKTCLWRSPVTADSPECICWPVLQKPTKLLPLPSKDPKAHKIQIQVISPSDQFCQDCLQKRRKITEKKKSLTVNTDLLI